MHFLTTSACTRRHLSKLSLAMLAALLASVSSVSFFSLHPFLALNQPPTQGILVVEGWIADSAIEAAIDIFKTGDYTKIATTGTTIGTGSYLVEWNSYAEMSTARLIKRGIAAKDILTIPASMVKRDRTYHAALALRNYLRKANILETNIHLVSVGPHGRRSRLLFSMALGKEYQVGITSLEDPTYDASRWWANSKGVRSTIGETIAYLYAKLLFTPREHEPPKVVHARQATLYRNPSLAEARIVISQWLEEYNILRPRGYLS